jgi:hypothetical protein
MSEVQLFQPNLFETTDGGIRGDGMEFRGAATFQEYDYESKGKPSITFSIGLESLEDPEGKYFSGSLTIGGAKVWTYKGLQLHTFKASTKLQTSCNFYIYGISSMLEAAKGTVFEPVVKQMVETGNFEPLGDFTFVAKAMPFLDKDGKVKTKVNTKTGMVYDVYLLVIGEFLTLGRIKAGAPAKAAKKATKKVEKVVTEVSQVAPEATSPAADEGQNEEILSDDVIEILSEYIGKPAVVVKAAFKRKNIDLECLTNVALLANSGFKFDGNALALN